MDAETYDTLFYEEPEEIAEYVPEEVELEDLEWEEVDNQDDWKDYLFSSGKQVLLGNYTEDVTVLGTTAQVGMAFFGIDALADVRDITADVAALWNGTFNGWQLTFDVIAIIPIVGMFKVTDEAALLYKSGDKIYMATKHADEVEDVIKGISKMPNKGFSTFDKLKNYLGKADDGYAWHHIVEQSQIGKSGFAPEQIHNVRNVVQIPSGYSGSVHAKITATYNSIQNFTNGMTLRNWLSTKSFEEQLEFGLEVLKEYGTVIATESGWIFRPFN